LPVLLAAGPALGQAPVGPSTAVLNGTRLGLFAEYGQADTDITFKGGLKESFDFRTAFAGFAAALTDRWDFFVRVGASQAETDGFDGNWNAAWGLGTRATLFKWTDFGWGAHSVHESCFTAGDGHTTAIPESLRSRPRRTQYRGICVRHRSYVAARSRVPVWRLSPPPR
jgi:hypothetical protein